MSVTVKQYDSINGVATTVEASSVVDVSNIELIANDATTGNLLIGLENSTEADANYLVLMPGESFRNLDIKTKQIFYKSSTGSVSFRFFGTKA